MLGRYFYGIAGNFVRRAQAHSLAIGRGRRRHRRAIRARAFAGDSLAIGGRFAESIRNKEFPARKLR